MISLDAVSSLNTTGTGPKTWTHVNAGNILIVGALVFSSTDDITGMKYNNVPMTKIGNSLQDGGGGTSWISLWYLLAPAQGSNSVEISYNNDSGAVMCGAVSYKSALQSGQPDSSHRDTATSSATFASATTSVANNCWVVGVGRATAGNMSTGTGTTFRSGVLVSLEVVDSNGPVSPGSYTLNYNSSNGAANWCGITISIAPGVSSAPTVSGYFEV